jgi:hypothetical protein
MRKRRVKPHEKLRRRAASAYLQEVHGLKYSPSTLAKYGTWGVGPPYQYDGYYAVYLIVDLDRWAEFIRNRPKPPARKRRDRAKLGPDPVYVERVARERKRDTLRNDIARRFAFEQKAQDPEIIDNQQETKDLQTINHQQKPQRLKAKATTIQELDDQQTAIVKTLETRSSETLGSPPAAGDPAALNSSSDYANSPAARAQPAP